MPLLFVLLALVSCSPQKGETPAAAGLHRQEKDLGPRKIAPGRGKIVLDIRLPRGYKFTRQAPFTVGYKAGDSSVLRFDTAPEKIDPKDVVFPFTIPLTASAGKTVVEIEASVYFCTEKSSTCFFQSLRLKAAFEVTPGAPSAVTLKPGVGIPEPSKGVPSASL